MTSAAWLTTVLLVTDWLIRIGLAVRVVMRRLAVGTTLAWLTIILSSPLIGAVAYLLFGELRLGRQRAERARAIHGLSKAWRQGLSHRYPTAPVVPLDAEPTARLVEAVSGIPPLAGNRLTLLAGADAAFAAIRADIERARSSVDLEFYIWSNGGHVDAIADALLAAVARGVTCRMLVDAVGSKAFLRSAQAERLRQGGVAVQAALPVSLVRMLFVRFDLRLHRKIVVIDGQVAYTGSLNMADPRYFKQSAGVGEWVDAMVRIEGPAVEGLVATFLEDWELETGAGLHLEADSLGLPPLPLAGPATLHPVASGPNLMTVAMRALLLEAIYTARQELILTTPYFVPDESLLIALGSAAVRGVEVTLLVPARNDSFLVDRASRAFEGDLAQVGVKIRLFDAGLLHTKSITIDGRTSLFGSLNLDPRSLQLNFEITLAIYDAAFTQELRALQQSYLARSEPFDMARWRERSFGTRLVENTARLFGPLL